ncbi:DUF4019 domain-containing protein [Ramlibacter sp. USB13]|uniref:DUF4019 domain-containing protein n=1 Tax=Ramlibacter cellulosilyticus TaxID=2764187 RepID=A0A923MSJ0_9BURK|nr:DUF4019 domain-containing protein [Ramlibacter cellulosilyticus]MBC5784191.1 DUF4019 domain-containing protein [Ramlibacter cellulosilyticus]
MNKRVRLGLLATGLVLAMAAQAQTKPAAAAAPAPAAAPAAAANGVISNPEFEKAGQNAAHGWLLLLDRKDWGTAWDASSGVFRQNVPLGTWMDNVPRVREPYGALVERTPGIAVYKKTLPGRPEGDYVTVVFVTKFANREVEETVTTVRESDGRWRVTGYSPK